MKDYRKLVYVLIAVSLVNLIVFLTLLPSLPETVPIHFNYKFVVDGMGSRGFLAVVPGITLVFSIAMAIEQKIRGRDYENNKPLTIFAFMFVALFIALSWMLYAMSGTGAQPGDTVDMPLDLLLGLGFSVLFIVLGNYLPTVKHNRTFGIRLPSTLGNEEIWRRTHRFGGLAFVIGGLFSAITSLVGYFTGARLLILAGLLIGVFGTMLVILIYVAGLKKKLEV